MSARGIQNQKAAAGGLFFQKAAFANTDTSAIPLQEATIFSHKNGRDFSDRSTADDVTDASLLPLIRRNAPNLMLALQQSEEIAKRQAPRIAFRVKGRIFLLDLIDILAVRAEGNYVSLRHQRRPYLVRESLSSMAEKLKPYGFIRIHRSVVVNVAVVEEIQPLPTGECMLRVKGGQEYLVTRKYKHNLRDLAQVWVGSEPPSG